VTPDLLRLVAFLALMQSGEGLIDKSPDYILEKFSTVALNRGNPDPAWALDATNRAIGQAWVDRWMA